MDESKAKKRGPMFGIIVIGVPCLLVGGCFALLLISSSGPRKPHEVIADQIEDLYFLKPEGGGQTRQISRLPAFDPTQVEHWRALLDYGETHTFAAGQLGRARIVFFVNTDTFVAPTASGDFNPDLYSKIFAFYAGYANGVQAMELNPFGSFEENFFRVYRENQATFADLHVGVEKPQRPN